MGTGASATKRRDAPATSVSAVKQQAPAPSESADAPTGATRIKCSRCGAISVVRGGTPTYKCFSCKAEVHVALPAVSKITYTDSQMKTLAAEKDVRLVLVQQADLTSRLWDSLGEELAMQEALWVSAAAEGEASHSCRVVAEAYATHDAAQVLEALEQSEVAGLPPVPDSLRRLIARLLREEDVEVLWRCLASAVSSADRVELEFWTQEAAAQGLTVPRGMKDMLTALRTEECAKLAEIERQASFDMKVKQALASADDAGLAMLAKEAGRHGLNSSSVEAALAERAQRKSSKLTAVGNDGGAQSASSSFVPGAAEASKTSQPYAQAQQQPQPGLPLKPPPSPQQQHRQPQQQQQQQDSSPSQPSIAELKRELEELGYSCEGILEKAELLKLLGIARGQKRSREAEKAASASSSSTSSPGPELPRSSSRGASKPGPNSMPSRSPDPRRHQSKERSPHHGDSSSSSDPFSGHHRRREAPSSSFWGSAGSGQTSNARWSSAGSQSAGRHNSAPTGAQSKGAAEKAKALACLGLQGQPTPEEIKKAYREAALRWHPDRRQNHARPEEAKQRFQEIRAAYELLEASVS